MDYWSILLTVVVVLLAIFYYSTMGYNYFKERGIPYSTPMPFLGNSWSALLGRRAFAYVVEDVYNLNADAKYVGMFDLMTPVISVRDPELIKSIAVKNFDHFPDHRGFVSEVQDPLFGKNLFALRGDRWREVRSLLTPAFTSSKMKAMFKLMSECATYFADYMTMLPEDKRVMDLKDAYTRYTNDVIATCAFGVQVDSMRDRDNKFYIYGREATVFNTITSIKFFLVRSMPLVARILRIRLVRKEIADFFKDLVANTIKVRDEQGINRPDMIQLMMETRSKTGPGKGLSIEDMTAQAFVFFFGGFESTSTLMCFASYEVAVNPDIQKRLQEEIDSTLDACNGELTYEAMNDMKYLDAVVNEALRLYPVAVAADRLCVKAFELPPALPGLKKHVVEPGSYVWFPIFGIQRDPQYFEDPKKFNPDRFVEDSKKIQNSGTFIPFGLGPRMCIGNRFALLETKVLLFQLLARCDLKPCEKTTIPLILNRKGLSMTSETGFWMKVQPRSKPHPSLVKVANGKAAV